MQEKRQALKIGDIDEPNTEDTQFFRECAELRRHAGMTQKQVAELMGTRESAVARLEALGGRGRRMLPRMATLKKYAGALGYRLVMTLEPLAGISSESAPSALQLLRARVAELEATLMDVKEQLRNSEAKLEQTSLQLKAVVERCP